MPICLSRKSGVDAQQQLGVDGVFGVD